MSKTDERESFSPWSHSESQLEGHLIRNYSSKGKRKTENFPIDFLTYCVSLDVMHIISANISLARMSLMAPPEYEGAENYTPLCAQEEGDVGEH